jgi:hypothetical protein
MIGMRGSVRGLMLVSIAAVLAAPSASAAERAGARSDSDYLTVVRTFADTLLAHGLDTYGKRHTAMWASVIDTRDYRVPRQGVPPTKGVRPHDRALGGSNLYHDVSTVRAFRVLSAVTGRPRYAQAAQDYMRDVLRYTQHPKTGLLGWGEHLYYEFWLDRTTIAATRRDNPPSWFQMPHELLAWTPPWEELWAVDAGRTAKAIRALRRHYNGDDPQVYLFNRHAVWNKTRHSREVMPWIKHAALFSYSFACLQKHEPSPENAHWMRHSGLLYWKLRDRGTNLVQGCLYHSSEPDAGKRCGTVGATYYAYWLFKAGEAAGNEELKRIGLTLLQSVVQQAWDAEQRQFASSMVLRDGRRRGRLKTWREGYSASNLWHLGRVSIYLHRKTPDPVLQQALRRITAILDREQLPGTYTAQNAADAMNYYLDHYDLTARPESLAHARRYADRAIKDLVRNGLITRKTDDPWYEAKLGAGDLAAALLRLHLRLTRTADPDLWDWSF